MMTTQRSWFFAAVITVATAVLLMIWAYHWLGESKYGGVATIDETINRRTEAPTQEITSSVTISQTFVASDNDLTEVRVFLATYMRANTATLRFTLSDEQGGVISTSETPPEGIVDNAYHSFTFSRIPESRGRIYTATITSPDGMEGNAFGAWLGNCDCYPAGELSINVDPQPNRELAMRVIYHHQNVVTWRELLNRMSQYKPFIFKGVGLILMAALSAMFSLVALGVLTYRVASAERKDVPETASLYWIGAGLIVAISFVMVTGAYENIL